MDLRCQYQGDSPSRNEFLEVSELKVQVFEYSSIPFHLKRATNAVKHIEVLKHDQARIIWETKRQRLNNPRLFIKVTGNGKYHVVCIHLTVGEDLEDSFGVKVLATVNPQDLHPSLQDKQACL